MLKNEIEIGASVILQHSIQKPPAWRHDCITSAMPQYDIQGPSALSVTVALALVDMASETL